LAVLIPFAAEATLKLYAKYVSKRDRLFRSDNRTGWSNASNLRTTRINAAGKRWGIKTDHNGHRVIEQNPLTGTRLLILGDSLSFGEGVDIEDRFDVGILSYLPGLHITNTGVMGYGTDQEYVVFGNWKHLLRPGDAVLVVLNQSDYFDVLRRRFLRRAKPYFEKADGSFALRPPRIGFWESWSDLSLVASAIARWAEPTVPEKLNLHESIDIIGFILRRIHEEAPRGVKVVLAHLGSRELLKPQLGLSSTMFCQFADACVDLDDVLAADPSYRLPDGHWSSLGHAAVAQALSKVLRDCEDTS
jgi:hypothetical protein